MLDRESLGHHPGDRVALTLTGLDPTTRISLRAYLLRFAWEYEEQADAEAAQGL